MRALGGSRLANHLHVEVMRCVYVGGSPLDGPRCSISKGTIIDNINIGLLDANEETARNACLAAGFWDDVSNMPFGLYQEAPPTDRIYILVSFRGTPLLYLVETL